MKTIIAALAVVLFLTGVSPAAANTYISSSAQMAFYSSTNEPDARVDTLKRYLASKNSPMADKSEVLVQKADEYGLDWRLVPAISGVESSFGKRIPYNSYNAYGWNNGNFKFETWEESIEVVSKALREKYLDRGATNINRIGRRYAPPSPTWSQKVKFFMNQIEPLPLEFDLQ